MMAQWSTVGQKTGSTARLLAEKSWLHQLESHVTLDKLLSVFQFPHLYDGMEPVSTHRARVRVKVVSTCKV